MDHQQFYEIRILCTLYKYFKKHDMSTISIIMENLCRLYKEANKKE
jgi:hypothetical protein